MVWNKNFFFAAFIACSASISVLALAESQNVRIRDNHHVSVPYNNNQQRIDINPHTGRVFRSSGDFDDASIPVQKLEWWKDQVMQRNSNGNAITLVNNNEHVIVQHNGQMQTMPQTLAPTGKKSQLPINPSWYVLLANAVQENKGSIIIGAIGLGWAAMVAKLLYASYSIAQYNGWGTWYSHIAIENVYQNEQALFAQKVFAEIQRRYQAQSNNFLSPLINFMHDVDAEILFLKNFLHMHQLLASIKLSFLFPAQSDVQATAIQRIARLEFLKNLVITFAAEYKIN